MFGAPSRARVGAGHAGRDTSKVRPMTPGNAWPDLYSVSAMGVSISNRSGQMVNGLPPARRRRPAVPVMEPANRRGYKTFGVRGHEALWNILRTGQERTADRAPSRTPCV